MPSAFFPEPARALVVGATGGLGGAFVSAIAAAGLPVHALSRGGGSVESASSHGAMDVADPASVESAFLGEGPPLRLVVVATGLLHDEGLSPEKNLSALDAGHLARSFAVNAIGPALVARRILPEMPREGRTIFAVLSARVGSIEDNRLGGWYGYRASKAALNQLLRTAAIERSRKAPESIVVALHPGTVATELSAPFRGQASRLFEPMDAARSLLGVAAKLTPKESGGFFAWDGTPIPF